MAKPQYILSEDARLALAPIINDIRAKELQAHKGNIYDYVRSPELEALVEYINAVGVSYDA